MLVSWDDYSQYLESHKKCSKHFQTTNQLLSGSNIPPIVVASIPSIARLAGPFIAQRKDKVAVDVLEVLLNGTIPVGTNWTNWAPLGPIGPHWAPTKLECSEFLQCPSHESLAKNKFFNAPATRLRLDLDSSDFLLLCLST